MEKHIGKYKLFKRTEYSKIQVVDNLNNRIDRVLEDKVINDYTLQTSNPEKYFKIEDDVVVRFKNDDNMSFIFLPESIRKIGPELFSPSKIDGIYIPEGVEHICREAFKDAEFIDEIYLPDTIRSVSKEAFARCGSLRSMRLSENLEMISDYMFTGCGLLKDLTIPNSVKTIDDCAFNWCLSLKKINIPRSFEGFGRTPFAHSGITTLQISYDIRKISTMYNQFRNFLDYSGIKKLEIHNVPYIDPEFLENAKGKIKEIDFIGSRRDFDYFKKVNKDFTEIFTGVRVNFKDSLEDKIDEYGKIKIPEWIVIGDVER